MDHSDKLGRKITATLLASQSLFSASTIMIFTVSSIIAVELAGGNEGWTGVPSTLVLAGAAVGAYPMGRLMDRVGRRVGLSLGHLAGIAGAGIAGLAVVIASLPLFLLGVLLMGLTKGVLDMGRYAAAEANLPHRRATAISLVVLGGTVGSIGGPALIQWAGGLADSLGLPTFSGPWFVAALFLAVSLLMINIFLRPDPQEIGRQLAAMEPDQVAVGPGRSLAEIWAEPRIKLALAAMVFGQVVMVLLMTVTPVHMHGHHHEIASISWVIMAHTLGMFGLSFVTGWLVDRLGRPAMILAGSLVLAAACLVAPFSTGVAWLAFALFLLGLGWNFCFVAGSSLLSDVLRPQEKGQGQGMADTLVNVASGAGSLSSGLTFAAFGFGAMSWVGLALALAPVAVVLLMRWGGQNLALKGGVPS